MAYCNAVQNRVGFIRYPLGELGSWSTDAGESTDVMTRVPRIYPCVEAVAVRKVKDDWRASITGDPSMLSITYRPRALRPPRRLPSPPHDAARSRKTAEYAG